MSGSSQPAAANLPAKPADVDRLRKGCENADLGAVELGERPSTTPPRSAAPAARCCRPHRGRRAADGRRTATGRKRSRRVRGGRRLRSAGPAVPRTAHGGRSACGIPPTPPRRSSPAPHPPPGRRVPPRRALDLEPVQAAVGDRGDVEKLVERGNDFGSRGHAHSLPGVSAWQPPGVSVSASFAGSFAPSETVDG